jgi:hypothetical protein
MEYDVDLGPVLLSDWYHGEYYDIVESIMAPGASGMAISDTVLINGKGVFDCSSLAANDTTPCDSNAGLSQFRFRRGQVHRLRLVNTGAEALQRFSIDGHTMTVIANDFVPIEPYETEAVTLGIGQRADVLVVADGDASSYWMRSEIPDRCGNSNNPQGLAIIFYDEADETLEPQSTARNATGPAACANDDLSITEPLLVMPLPEPDLTLHMNIALFRNESNNTLWSLNDVSARGNLNSPTLLMAGLGNRTFEEEWNIVNTGNARSVRVVVNNTSPSA